MKLVYFTTGICLTLISLFPEGQSAYSRSTRKKWKFESAAMGYLYVSRYFRSRYTPTMNPNVCLNVFDTPPELNDTLSNGSRIYAVSRKTYQNFICPLSDLDKGYCCGSERRQTCCGFWANYVRMTGALFGILFGFVICIWLIKGILKSIGKRCPKLKRCGRLCRPRNNEVQQEPPSSSSTAAVPSPSSPPIEADPVEEPKPITVAPLAPPSYSSLSVREVDIFGEPLSTSLPPPPDYAILESQEGRQPASR